MLTIALKEWAVVCQLLLEGHLALLLRKGGIQEQGGAGVFELEHRCFALFPSWAHQSTLMIKEQWHDRVQILDEPDLITFGGTGEVIRIWQVPSRQALDTLGDLHCWTTQYVDMRFHYKPHRPLYLVALRASRLRAPKMVSNNSGYAGCRSWVPLRTGDAVDNRGAEPALDEATLDQIVARIDEVFTT